ncbi:proteophosphoglycan ppg4 [Rhodotorula toruloides]|uniref:Proteophosphoglycan ppg4 n=1 Tax=Rhodotorula toruloides TaxID=5286 RepID=A0A511KND9_RHOTO|nr:proteophosphoglycan ppg4 [Rhodotorula toruloides]
MTLPNSTSHTFSTAADHTSRRAARRAVFALAYESGVHKEAACLGDELGWKKEAEEEKAEKERMKGGERPWEALKAEQERWMAESIKWRFETEELNSVHSCSLTVPISPSSPPIAFTTPQTFRSHREAKDAAARVALAANVPAQYEQAFKERLNRDAAGYIQFGDITVADAAMADAQVEEEEAGNETERDGPLDWIALIKREVSAAFGGLKGWLDWKQEHAEEDAARRNPHDHLSRYAAHPQPPSPFTVTVPPLYHTKHHVRLACIVAAFREGLVGRLEPYKREREEVKQRAREERKKREEERRARRERGELEMPRAGTVKYEDLFKPENPAAYLNTCAQRWTGDGSPLKFAYSIQHGEGSNAKQYGCTVTVFVNTGLSKSYSVEPSPERTTRRAAKDAAVRLALKEHVLDLLMPASFNPNKPVPMKSDVMRDVGASREASEPTFRPPSCVSAFNSDGLTGPLKPKLMLQREAVTSTEATPASVWAHPIVVDDESVEKSASTPPSFEPFLTEGDIDAAPVQAQAALPLAPPTGTTETSSAVPASSLADANPIEPLVPSTPPSSIDVVAIDDKAPPPKESAVRRLDKLCIARLGYGYLPEYEVRQSPEKAVMNLALTSDIVTEWAAEGKPAATGALPSMTVDNVQRSVAPVIQPSSTPEKEFPVAPAEISAPLVSDQPAAPSKKRYCLDSATGCSPDATLEVSQEPVTKRVKLDNEPNEEVSETPIEITTVEGLALAEVADAGAGGSVEILRLGCREFLGPGVKFEPYYQASVQGSLFGATVFVCLDKNATDSRAFSLPALYASREEAYEAVARMALQAGALDLLESRVRPRAKPASSPKDRRDAKGQGRGGKKHASLPRTEEEQAALRRASYGGFGAATAFQLVKLRAQAEKAKKHVEVEDQAQKPEKEPLKEETIEVERNPLLPGLPVETEEDKTEGEAMEGLKAFLESRALALPTVHRETSTTPGKSIDRVRVWLVHHGLRFELLAAHASKAEEKLAAKVLEYLKKQEVDQTQNGA